MANALATAGLTVLQISEIVGAASLAFSLEIVWAPAVDSVFTRRRWYVAGAIIMCLCLASVLLAPWESSSVPLLIILTFCACSGAGMSLAAAKGIMAYDVAAPLLGRASGFYTAGGIVAKSVAGAGTLWLLTHVPNRPLITSISIGAAAIAMTAILLASRSVSSPVNHLLPALRSALMDLLMFVRTPAGILVVILCVVPFGTSTLLANAIAKEWAVRPDQLAASIPIAAALGIAGAILAGRLSVRYGPWSTYMVAGWIMIALLVVMAFAPRSPSSFFALLFLHRAGSGACYAALLGLVMSTIGRGAAATKAAALWSMVNFSEGYPALVDGRVHDVAGTTAMLLTHATMDAAGFVILLLVARSLRVRFRALFTIAVATT
jgi:MFS family permease